ncbi:MAG: glycoside hydrolase [Clostridia bacterium]|nr:glycoside hydrolase [Clostridia bacterium]
MKIVKAGQPYIIQSNPDGKHKYFGWPTVARLKNGVIAVGSSGNRLRHVCPFGKAELSFSYDEGRTFTRPTPVIDTPLDDRDCGLTPFGKDGLIVTSFNNTVAFQRSVLKMINKNDDYIKAYLDTVTPEDEAEYLASEYVISHDNGATFGRIKKSPVTSPHGPCETRDGRVIYVGRRYPTHDDRPDGDVIECAEMDENGDFRVIGTVPSIFVGEKKAMSCEPDTICLPDGTLICHIRVQSYSGIDLGLFTVYQTESTDGGVTWSTPRQLLGDKGGSPAHLMLHSSGVLISVYGYREAPYGIRAAVSRDNGKTWQTDLEILSEAASPDLGYPSSVELSDGSVLTVYYVRTEKDSPAIVMGQIWSLTE